MSKRISWVAFAMLALSIIALRGNWGSDAGGSVATGAFRALGTAQVAMENEDLDIELFRDRAKVHVEYALRNTGEAVTVKAGFPCLGVLSEKKNYTEVEDYSLTANGQPVPYHIEPGDVTNWKRIFGRDFLGMGRGPEDESGDHSPCSECRIWWLASAVHFDKAETKHIAIQYEALYEYGEGGPSDDADYNSDNFRYLLSTASVWKGPIRKGRVVLKAVTIDLKSITVKPANRFKKVPGGLLWEFTNLKPTLADNIEVCLNNKFSTIFNYAAGDDGDTQKANSSWYSFEGDKYYFDFHDYSASASSEKTGYPATAVGDFERETAWVAGRNGGIGESVLLSLKKPQHVDQVGIIPGYAKSKQLYFANNRVRELEVTVNERHTVTATLPDEYISFSPDSKKAYELIDLGDYAGEAKTIKLTVKQVYPGTKHNDTCISELLLRKRLKIKPEVHGAR
jgi:hypothetical protein